jgi:thiamine-phosphate pyrophosphorylase
VICTSSASAPRGWRNRIPRQWLFTDERLGGQQPQDPLWRALAALPAGGGIVFRHYRWPLPARRVLFQHIAAIARRRHLCLVASRLNMRADGQHWPTGHWPAAASPPPFRRRQLVTAAAHGEADIHRAFARGADLVFLSPVFATRSHPGEAVLGPLRFGLMARHAAGPVLALGGMDAQRARRLAALGAQGYGGIDCWCAG